MSSTSRLHSIGQYLSDPIAHPYSQIKDPVTSSMMSFVLSYLGQLFIQGYRVFEQIGDNTMILSLMEYQLVNIHENDGKNIPLAQYKILHFLVDVIDRDKRLELFKDLHSVADNLAGNVDTNLLYLKSQKFSVMNKAELLQTRQPDSHKYFQHFDYLPQKNGYHHIDPKDQGTRLHALIEFILKGNGFIRHLLNFRRTVTGEGNQIKFSYNLEKVIHTIRSIIGRQIIENDYLIMSSQKWMRRQSQKSYKRFDLILRNQDKICIIDWKFSKIQASQKINTKAFLKKNQLYCQLAKKDFRSDVELKFCCIHVQTHQDHYHKSTQAKYGYKVQQIMLDPLDLEAIDSDDQVQILNYQHSFPINRQIQHFIPFELNQSNSPIQNFRHVHNIIEEEPIKQNLYPTPNPNDAFLGQRAIQRYKKAVKQAQLDQISTNNMFKRAFSQKISNQVVNDDYNHDGHLRRKKTKPNQQQNCRQKSVQQIQPSQMPAKQLQKPIRQLYDDKQQSQKSIKQNLDSKSNQLVFQKILINQYYPAFNKPTQQLIVEELQVSDQVSFQLIEKDAAESIRKRQLQYFNKRQKQTKNISKRSKDVYIINIQNQQQTPIDNLSKNLANSFQKPLLFDPKQVVSGQTVHVLLIGNGVNINVTQKVTNNSQKINYNLQKLNENQQIANINNIKQNISIQKQKQNDISKVNQLKQKDTLNNISLKDDILNSIQQQIRQVVQILQTSNTQKKSNNKIIIQNEKSYLQIADNKLFQKILVSKRQVQNKKYKQAQNQNQNQSSIQKSLEQIEQGELNEYQCLKNLSPHADQNRKKKVIRKIHIEPINKVNKMPQNTLNIVRKKNQHKHFIVIDDQSE